MSDTRAKPYSLSGGLDVVTPALAVRPGRALAMLNYEPYFSGGYRRINGYERMDGRPRPSDTTFIGFSVGSVEGLAVGDTITGGTSGATGEIVGLWDDDGTHGYDVVGVSRITGVFELGEFLQGGSSESFTVRLFDDSEADYHVQSPRVITVTGVPGQSVLDGWTPAAAAEDVIDADELTNLGNEVVINGDGTFTILGGNAITSEPMTNFAPTQALEDEWMSVARELYRADIQPVPGSGPVNGVWQRGEHRYAVRDDDISANAGLLYLATDIGWDTAGITMAKYVYFDGGGGGGANALPLEGDSINGQTSGATAVVHRVIEHAGSTVNNDTRGYMVLTNVVGLFQNNENIRIGSTVVAVADGASRTFGFAPGGHYRFINHNFYGSSGTYRTYGVSGVGPAFEIDENNVVSPIMFPKNPVTDQPEFNEPFEIEEHLNYLFLAMPGGRFIKSVVGEPMQINGFLGAAEFGVGDEITGLSSITGGVLAINSQKRTHGLFGTGDDDWEMKLLAEKAGCRAHTARVLDTVYGLSDLGITSLMRTQTFGSFSGATVSQLVQPIVQALRQSSTDAAIVRSSNQYRLYFSDGSFLIMYVPTVGDANVTNYQEYRGLEFGFAQYPIPVLKAYNTEDETGLERSYFASSDGYVYEDRIGSSFDGEEIPSYLRLVFNNLGSPGYNKRFRSALLDISVDRPIDLLFSSDLSYGSREFGATSETLAVEGAGGFFDVSTLDSFYWDGQVLGTARADLTGSGENISMLFYHSSAVVTPFVLQGVTIRYDVRRLRR